MKIGIVTLHYGFNEGAVLQAYATYCAIKHILPGAAVEIVDQRYPSKVAVYGKPSDPRTKAIQKAIDHWLPLSSISHRGADSRRLIREIGASYDVLVYGSDQIWGLEYRKPLRRLLGNLAPFLVQRNPFYPPYPNIYWPSPFMDAKQIVLAASAGTFDWGVIPHRHRVRMRQGLEACSAISCRDSFALDLVRSVAPKLSGEAVLVCDPTFNRHFRSEVVSRKEQAQIQRRLVSVGLDLNRNRVVLAMKPSERSVGIARGFVEKGYQVVGLTPGLIGVDVDASALGIGPCAWANIFRSFDFCVTERMHAAIFCAINNVPFFGLDINRVQGRKGTKFTELATALGVEGAVEDPSMVIGSSSDVDRMEALLKGPTWDWSLINAKIDRMSDGFLGFLGAALNKCAGGGAP